MKGSAKAWLLAFVVAAGVGFGTLVGVGCAIGANACPFGSNHGFTEQDGQALYRQTCILCHGVNGEGLRGAPSLVSGHGAGLTPAELRAKIARGKPLGGMPAFSKPPYRFTQGQIEAVARYVVKLREAA